MRPSMLQSGTLRQRNAILLPMIAKHAAIEPSVSNEGTSLPVCRKQSAASEYQADRVSPKSDNGPLALLVHRIASSASQYFSLIGCATSALHVRLRGAEGYFVTSLWQGKKH